MVTEGVVFKGVILGWLSVDGELDLATAMGLELPMIAGTFVTRTPGAACPPANITVIFSTSVAGKE